MPSIVPEGATRGWIIPIGGAENKENDRHILERFVTCSGGRDADIVVIPTASRLHETGHRYEKLFKDIGAARVDVMDFDTRRDCQEPGRLQPPRGRDRHLLHRRQPAPAHDPARRHAGGQARAHAQCQRRHRRRHQRRREHPERTHDRLRRRGLLGDLRQRAPRARPRAHQPLHHRPALPAARPARPPAHRARLQPVRHRHRARRGHRGLHRPGRDGGSGGQRRRDHRGRVRRELLLDGRGLRRPAGLHARPAPARAGGRRPPSTCTRASPRQGRCPSRRSSAVRILDRSVYVGPSLYAHFPVIRLELDLGELEAWPTVRLGEGFVDRLAAALPGLAEHGCSYGEPGGFFRRMREDEGTWLGHVLEHVAIELQNIAGEHVTFGKTRGAGRARRVHGRLRVRPARRGHRGGRARPAAHLLAAARPAAAGRHRAGGLELARRPATSSSASRSAARSARPPPRW